MIAEAEDLGYRTVLGSVYPNDARNPLSFYHSSFVLKYVRPRAIIVLHEGMPHRRGVISVLRRVLSELQRRGYRIVTLSKLNRHVG